MAETPIEAIEQTFNPPDVPVDLYPTIDLEANPDILDLHFLAGRGMEIDEETDPDYYPIKDHNQPSKITFFPTIFCLQFSFINEMNDLCIFQLRNIKM